MFLDFSTTQHWTQVFANHNMSAIFNEGTYGEIKRASGVTKTKIEEIIKELGCCPIVLRNDSRDGYKFTVVPYQFPKQLFFQQNTSLHDLLKKSLNQNQFENFVSFLQVDGRNYTFIGEEVNPIFKTLRELLIEYTKANHIILFLANGGLSEAEFCFARQKESYKGVVIDLDDFKIDVIGHCAMIYRDIAIQPTKSLDKTIIICDLACAKGLDMEWYKIKQKFLNSEIANLILDIEHAVDLFKKSRRKEAFKYLQNSSFNQDNIWKPFLREYIEILIKDLVNKEKLDIVNQFLADSTLPRIYSKFLGEVLDELSQKAMAKKIRDIIKDSPKELEILIIGRKENMKGLIKKMFDSQIKE